MLNNIIDLLNSKKKILVIGEVVLDKYIYGKTNRLSSEVPLPVFNETKIEYRLGGAGNVAANLSNFGLSVYLLSLSELAKKYLLQKY